MNLAGKSPHRVSSRMATNIALLRGVNVGGNRKVAMSDLRAFLSRLGLGDPRSLLQSGNVVFRSDASPAKLEAMLEAEAGERLGLQTTFFVRTAEEWRSVVARNQMCIRDRPNATLAGVADSAPCAPVPVKLTATLGSEASLVTVILPLELAVEVGLNCAVNDVLCPALSVSGVDNPV